MKFAGKSFEKTGEDVLKTAEILDLDPACLHFSDGDGECVLFITHPEFTTGKGTIGIPLAWGKTWGDCANCLRHMNQVRLSFKRFAKA